ncbi:MAG: hypothetical protein ABI741_10675 [Ferruginibacter sp.]
MKQLIMPRFNKYFFLSLILSIVSFISFGQDSTATSSSSTTSNTTTTTQTWYAQPWVWVVGGVVLLVLIVALITSGKNTTEKVSVTNIRSRD